MLNNSTAQQALVLSLLCCSWGSSQCCAPRSAHRARAARCDPVDHGSGLRELQRGPWARVAGPLAITSCLAFASSQVREAHLPGGRGAPPHFAVNGAIQHNIGPLRPNEGTWAPARARSQLSRGEAASHLGRACTAESRRVAARCEPSKKQSLSSVFRHFVRFFKMINFGLAQGTSSDGLETETHAQPISHCLTVMWRKIPRKRARQQQNSSLGISYSSRCYCG